MSVLSFLKTESGAVTVDWIVLTSLLVGTGLAVMSTVSGGVGALTGETHSSLQGQIIRTTFSGDYCTGGLDGLQSRENARVVSAQTAGQPAVAINVVDWTETEGAARSDQDLLQAYRQTLRTLDDTAYTQANTMAGLMECQMVIRGLL
jgi:hypothetical protein